MSKVLMLRCLVNERLTAAAEEIFALFERTIAEYEEELCRSKDENQRKQELLDSGVSSQVEIHTSDAQVQVIAQNIKQEHEKYIIPPETVDLTESSITAELNYTEEDREDSEEEEITIIIDQHGQIISETAAQTDRTNPVCHVTRLTDDDWNQVRINDEALDTTDFQSSSPVVRRRQTAKKSKLECSVCGKKLKGPKMNLERHMLIHTGEKPFSCTVCEKGFTQQGNLKRHMDIHRDEEKKEKQSEEKAGEEEGCGVGEVDTELESETKEQNKETKEQESPVVGAPQTMEIVNVEHCNQAVMMQENISMVHNMMAGTSAQDIQCTICNRVFTTNTRLKRHMFVHTGEKPYNCPICNKLFSQKYNVNLHMAVHTRDKPYSCTMCEKSYCRKDDLRTHMSTHTGEILFSCFICDQVFKQRNCLTTHMRLHTGDRPYRCTVCNKTFIQKSNFNRHRRMHTGDRPYSCPVCPQKFLQRCDIRKHMAVHT